MNFWAPATRSRLRLLPPGAINHDRADEFLAIHYGHGRA